LKKGKLFLILAVIMPVILLGTAATCNFCGMPLSIEKENGVLENKEQADAEGDTGSGNVISQEESDNGNPDGGEDEPMAPEISIFIQEGPLYSAEDDICYYRIGSEVYGSPFPKVAWSKDDSDNAFGDYVAQVNLRRGETYTIVATASNSEGTATSSLTLSWGCDGEGSQGDGEESSQEDGEEGSGQEEDDYGGEDQPVNMMVPVSDESGCASQDKADVRKGEILVGTSETGMEYRGYLSFSLIGYEGTLKWAKIHIDPPAAEGSLAPLGDLRIGVLEYGTGPIDSRVVNVSSTRLASFPGYSGGPIVIEDEKLLEQLRAYFQAGKSRFQLTLYWRYVPVGDGENHFIRTSSQKAKLYTQFQ